MSESNLSPVSDVSSIAPSEHAFLAPTGSPSNEGDQCLGDSSMKSPCSDEHHCLGDSSSKSPCSDVFALDGSCMSEFSIFPTESQSYIEMHATPDFPKYEASIPSDLAQLQT